MTSINGIDPILLNIVKTPTQKPAIIKSQKSQVQEDKKDRDKREKGAGRPSQQMRQSLAVAVDNLNKLLKINQVSLYAQIVERDEELKVQLIDPHNMHIIAEMNPEKVFRLVAEFNIQGFSVNESI